MTYFNKGPAYGLSAEVKSKVSASFLRHSLVKNFLICLLRYSVVQGVIYGRKTTAFKHLSF